MPRPRRIALAAVAAAFAMCFAPARPFAAVGPTVMLFYGAPLKERIFIKAPETEVFGNLLSETTVRPQDLADRPFISVALFWGPASDPARNGTRVLTDLTPQMAWQHGRFYPRQGTKPALFLVTALTKNAQVAPVPGGTNGFVWGGEVPASAAPVLERLGLGGSR